MKIQSIIFPGIFILLIVFFSSCGKGKQKQFGNIEFDHITVNETAYLVENTSSPGCNLTIDYTYPLKTSIPEVTQLINETLLTHCFGEAYQNMEAAEAIDSFKNTYIRDYRKDLQPLYQEDMKRENNNMEVSSWYSYYQHIEAKPIKGHPSFLIYQINENEFRGGAHGAYYTFFINFNPEDGQPITLEDIFKSGYETSLNEKLLNKLMKIQNVKSMEELQDKGYLLWSDMYASSNFHLEKNDITFFYNTYEIAPYSNGTTEITLSYKEVKELMKISL